MNFRIGFVIAALLLAPVAASGMTQSQLPSKFNIPWGNSAASSYIRTIPQNSQIGIVNCAASLTDGFPPLTFLPIGAGGCPPFGQDFNGILKQITQWNQWQAVSSGLPWDSTFSTAIGGYPKGAIVQSNVLTGRLWQSTADNNTNNPDSTGASATNWIVLPGTAQPGTPVANFSTTPYPNTVIANGLTVGNASSNATNLASASTFWLFSYIWNNCPTSCTLFNSSGGTVSRGANASADFAANDAIATPSMQGSAMIGADANGTTRLTGVPLSGSYTVPTSVVGENLHTLTLTELATGIGSSGFTGMTSAGAATVSGGVVPVTNSTVTFTGIPGGASSGFNAASVNSGVFSGVASFPVSVVGTTTTLSTSTNTGGGAHNTVERSWLVYWNLAL